MFFNGSHHVFWDLMLGSILFGDPNKHSELPLTPYCHPGNLMNILKTAWILSCLNFKEVVSATIVPENQRSNFQTSSYTWRKDILISKLVNSWITSMVFLCFSTLRNHEADSSPFGEEDPQNLPIPWVDPNRNGMRPTLAQESSWLSPWFSRIGKGSLTVDMFFRTFLVEITT